MKFLISIPCQLIVVILVALTISSVVSKPLQPLAAALSISNSHDQPTVTDAPQPFAAFDYRPYLAALLAALVTFFLWHANRYYRSESAIKLAKRSGGSIRNADGLTGVMRYLFSDVKINFSHRNVSTKTLQNLQQIHNLTSLNLAHCGISEKSLKSLVHCRFLEEIDVSGNGFSRSTLLSFRRKTTATMHHHSMN